MDFSIFLIFFSNLNLPVSSDDPHGVSMIAICMNMSIPELKVNPSLCTRGSRWSQSAGLTPSR